MQSDKHRLVSVEWSSTQGERSSTFKERFLHLLRNKWVVYLFFATIAVIIIVLVATVVAVLAHNHHKGEPEFGCTKWKLPMPLFLFYHPTPQTSFVILAVRASSHNIHFWSQPCISVLEHEQSLKSPPEKCSGPQKSDASNNFSRES